MKSLLVGAILVLAAMVALTAWAVADIQAQRIIGAFQDDSLSSE